MTLRLALASLLLTTLGWAPQSAHAPADTTAMTVREDWNGRPAPDFSLPVADGSSTTLTELKGQVVLISFWSVHSLASKQEEPMLDSLGHLFSNQGVMMIGVSPDPAADTSAWMEQHGGSLITVADPAQNIIAAYSVRSLPALVLVGKDGKVRRYWDGLVSQDMVTTAVRDALKH